MLFRSQGQWVTTSLLQAQVFMLDFQASRWLNDHEVPGQAGNNHPTNIPTGVFQTADGYINVAASGEKIWERLCRTIGGEELLANPLFTDSKLRLKNRDALNVELNRLLSLGTSAQWLKLLNEAGVPSGPINTIDKVFADPQVQHLNMVQEIESPHYHPLRVVAQPVKLSECEAPLRSRPPEWGEHTDEVLGSIGYSADEIADLRKRGVV